MRHELNPEYKELCRSRFQIAYYILEDVADSLRNELDDLEFDPERLNEIEDRLNEINQLKRKYGQYNLSHFRIWSKN